jgi:hypothetical protein
VDHFRETHKCDECQQRQVATGKLLIIYQYRLYLTQNNDTANIRRRLNQTTDESHSTYASPVTTPRPRLPPNTHGWCNEGKHTYIPDNIPSSWTPVQDCENKHQLVDNSGWPTTKYQSQQVWIHPTCARQIEQALRTSVVDGC